MKRPTAKPVRLFVSYAHTNAVWFKRLYPVLKFQPRVDSVGIWHDQELRAGDPWDKVIRDELERMDVFVCLVSFEFLASDYIMDVELKRALARHKKGAIEIVPVVLFDIDLERDCMPLHEFNPLPAWGKCWSDYEKDNGLYQDAHMPIREGLRQAIQKVQGRRAAGQSP